VSDDSAFQRGLTTFLQKKAKKWDQIVAGQFRRRPLSAPTT